MAPPSELACGWSNLAMIGLEIPWTRRALCAIQVVAIEPPRFCAMSRLVNALFAHFRGSMALFFHLSRIIRASDSGCSLLCLGIGAAEGGRGVEGLGTAVPSSGPLCGLCSHHVS